ncbi:hypothetical protein, partial [Enterobacter cloacae]|uniref:hypothetical protein n=1 Tax=Enterobacter cloacae TaxID=550 RepID=UPI00388D01B0
TYSFSSLSSFEGSAKAPIQSPFINETSETAIEYKPFNPDERRGANQLEYQFHAESLQRLTLFFADCPRLFHVMTGLSSPCHLRPITNFFCLWSQFLLAGILFHSKNSRLQNHSLVTANQLSFP